MYSWISRGMVSISDLAAWRFNNDEGKVSEILTATPGQMRDLLSLESLPEVTDENEKKLVKDAEQTLLPGVIVLNYIYVNMLLKLIDT